MFTRVLMGDADFVLSALIDQHQFLAAQTDYHQMNTHHHQQIYTVCHSPATTPSMWIPNKKDTQVGRSSSSIVPCPHLTKTR